MRRVLLGLLFLGVVLGVVLGLHLYLIERLVYDAGLEGAARTAAAAVLATLGGVLVAFPAAQRLLGAARVRWLAWPASIWMGLAFLLVVLLGASDLALWLAGGAAVAAGVAEPGPAAGAGRALAVLVAGTALGAVALRSGLRPPRLRRVEVGLRRWPRVLDGLRIVQISDVHIGSLLGRGFAASLVRRVNELSPDLVAVTGDLVDGSVRHLADQVAPLRELRARHGVFFVTGNHDHYSGAEAWSEQARTLGMRVLRNERVAIEERGAVFDLAGVEDHHARLVSEGHAEDLPGALDGRDPARPVVLLAHDPSTFKQASRFGVDLQISGHTHGGQIFPFGLLVRLVIPWVAGLYEQEGSLLYVSRGTGFWGPPMRLFAPAEITELVLRAPGAGSGSAR
ncbi:MAG TPA: metallophosphoesterase [Vicinamibacteria bacterium]|nr:metallophosphoesterase [Vicinamibacteria bacterium]